LIEHSNLHPITSLADRTLEEKKRLLQEGVVFVKDLKHTE